jgi:alkyl hydroperoxide reductase subunit AhpF
MHVYWPSIATTSVGHTSTSTVNVESYISRYPESFSSVIEVKEEDRDSFRFLYNINGMEKHLRFTRVPFGAEASSFVLDTTRAVRRRPICRKKSQISKE